MNKNLYSSRKSIKNDWKPFVENLRKSLILKYIHKHQMIVSRKLNMSGMTTSF